MKRYYEAYDLRYAQVHERGLHWFDSTPTPAVSQTMARWGVDQNAPMLEIGCGEGRDAAVLMNQGCNLLATDVSPQAIDDCRQRFPQWADRFQPLDCLRDTLKGRFDFIYAVAVLHMLVPDEDRQGLLHFIRDHLTENGVGLLVVMGDGTEEWQTDIRCAFDLQERVHEQSGTVLRLASTSCRIVSRETLLEEIRRAGLLCAEESATTWGDCDTAMYAVVKRKAGAMARHGGKSDAAVRL